MIKRFAAALLTISAAGLLFISNAEEVRTEAYLDAGGVPTICAGVTRNVFLGQKRTLGECETLLVQETSYAGKAIAHCTHVDLTQEQYDALVSLAYNIGGGAYCRSTLVRKLNAGHCRDAAREFDRWIRVKKRVLRGLVKRRAGERRMFEPWCLA